MAAAMMVAAPITAKADEIELSTESAGLWWKEGRPHAEAVNGIAEEGYIYTIPTLVYDGEDYSIPGGMDLMFEEESVPDYRQPGGGYKIKTVRMYYDDGCNWWWSVDGDTTYDWTGEEDDYGTYCDFTVDYNGMAYSGCYFSAQLDWDATDDGYGKEWYLFTVIVPQGYDDGIELTIKGGKMENGEAVVDESSRISFFLNGSSAAPTQPAPDTTATDEQPTPDTATAEEQPTPDTATTDEQPTPDAATTTYDGTIYTTKPGDNLSKIAKELYGDSKLWRNIYEMNKDVIKNPNVLYANMQLILP